MINSVDAPLTLPPTGALMARQAILDSQRKLFGYELFDRSLPPQMHSAASDAQFLFNVLLGPESEVLGGPRTLFINCTHDSLAGGHLDLVQPHNIVLEIPPLPASQAHLVEDHTPTLQELHGRGFRIAFDYAVLTRNYESWLPLADFIKFDVGALNNNALTSFIKLAQARTQARLVAEKVETQAQFELLSALGVHLFQGYWFARPVLVAGQRVRPAQAAILQLINLVRKQASTGEIEEHLKLSPTLSFQLLRFINSAGFGMQREITSFRHAVMLLGLKRLFKWAALLMTTSQVGDTAPAVGTTAVVRGRLMELLAITKLPSEEADNAFVVGVFSLLDTMLGMPLQEALANLNLPESVTEALLNRSGPLAPYLELTIACETGDENSFAQAATALDLDGNAINWAHVQALAWAETLLQA